MNNQLGKNIEFLRSLFGIAQDELALDWHTVKSAISNYANANRNLSYAYCLSI